MARRSDVLLLGLLTAAAIWTTRHSPTIFFDNQILLGPSLGVVALLRFGWAGLPVGIAAALCTVPMWGHPWAAVLMVLQLIWQQMFLSRFNGGPNQLGNGRIVIATIVFWALIGIPLNIVLYTSQLQGDLDSVSALAFKETAVSVVNSGLALVIFQIWQLLRQGRGRQELSMRGVTFAALLASISLPCIVMILAMGQQITAQSVEQFRLQLEQRGQALGLLLAADPRASIPASMRSQFQGLAVEALSSQGQHWQFNVPLLALVNTDYRPSSVQVAPPNAGLMLLVNRKDASVLEQYLGAYWRYNVQLSAGEHWQRITVIGPAGWQMKELLGLMKPSLQLLALVLIAVALVSEGLTSLLISQFQRILAPLADSTAASESTPVLTLGRSAIREVNALVEAISDRSAQLILLQQSLEAERNARARSALTLTEGIPVGTFALCRDPSGEIRLTFVSERWLEMLALKREEVLQNPSKALERIDPADHGGLMRRLAVALHKPCAFRWEGRLRIGPTRPWMAIEALPRALADGGTVWEGVVTDISHRVQVQQQLQEAFLREQATELERRQLLEQKLKTSLTAAAAVHEIQQPLSAILLNCRLAEQSLRTAPAEAMPPGLHSSLSSLTTLGDRVVATMERMRMLLRNVETEQSIVDLALCVESTVLFLHTDLRNAQVHCQTSGIHHPCLVLGDAAQLQIALVNLIRNAIQAMEAQAPATRRVWVQLVPIRQRVQLRVADSGPGFPDGFSSDTSWELLKSTKASGMGLGLFVAQTAASNHRGSLQIGHSSELGGAEVMIELPRLNPEAAAAPAGP